MAFRQGDKIEKSNRITARGMAASSLLHMVAKSEKPLERGKILRTLYHHIREHLFEEKMLKIINHQFKMNISGYLFRTKEENVEALKTTIAEELYNVHKITSGLLGLSARLLDRGRSKK